MESFGGNLQIATTVGASFDMNIIADQANISSLIKLLTQLESQNKAERQQAE